MILCNVGEVYSVKHRLSMLALNQARALILHKYATQRYINTIYKYSQASA